MIAPTDNHDDSSLSPIGGEGQGEGARRTDCGGNQGKQAPAPLPSKIKNQKSKIEKFPITFRPYQKDVFADRNSGVLILHWSRQIGKSFTLAAWAVDRILTRPGRLVTVLSNSRENGAEFVLKCEEVCRLFRVTAKFEDVSADGAFDNMRLEVRITRKKATGRIKVLAANPRTARGFSGDLILDEFAYHEDSAAIWEAAEPILASNPDFLCRIASTGNGRHNLFYRLTTNPHFALSRVTRTQAHAMGVKIYDANTREEIPPEKARSQALDKSAYDQNYECSFADENLTLLSHELINAAEREGVGFICEQDWSNDPLELLRNAGGPLYAGFDIARKGDLSVITVVEDLNGVKVVRAILRMQNLRLPEQQARLGEICRLPRFCRAAIDMTGLGLGLFEYAQEEFGASRIVGINFASSVPATRAVRSEGRRRETVRVTEALAMELLQAYEDRRIWHPADQRLRDDLRKPEKLTTPGGRVSIAATRDEAGHADHFWSFALALEAGARTGTLGAMTLVPRRERAWF